MGRWLNLIKEFAITDFKLRYSSSVLGYLWSLLYPLLIFATLYIIFSIFMRFEQVEHYQLYLLLGIILWLYFSEATTNGMQAIVNKANLVKKAKFPREIIIISSNITALFTLLLNLLVFSLFFIGAKAAASATLVLFPLYLLELIMISVGVSFLLSALFVKFRDLTHLWGIMLQIGFWITPIIYPISMVPEKYAPLIYLNPIAGIIIHARNAVIYNTLPTAKEQVFTFLAAFAILAAGFAIFKLIEPKIAEKL